MQILGSLSQLLGRRTETSGERQRQLLEPAEIRMIASVDTARLSHFAASRRLHAVDPKGDTPLHLAARMGNLALCDLFVRAGADARSQNHENQTPADVAFAEGHSLAAQLLVSLLRDSEEVPSREALPELPHADAEPRVERTVRSFPTQPPPLEQPEDPIAFDDPLIFEPVEDAETFFGRSAGQPASGTFVAFVSTVPTDSSERDGNWEVDLSSAWIGGDGIASKATTPLPDNGDERDFLKVRSRGRQSVKRAVVQSSTRLSIDPGTCVTWAADILEERAFSSDETETLISLCEGNGDPDELRAKLQRTLEAAGLVSVETTESGDVLWDIRSDVSANDLAEAIEATFSRAVRLPGTRRFDMDKSNEARLLDPMVLAKKELHLGILACEPAVETILNMIDQLLDGSIAPSFVTMRTIVPSRPEHAETREFLEAVDALKSWNSMAGYDDHIDAGTACHAHRGHRLARTRACLETGAGRLKTMLIDLGNLPSDPALLQRLLRDMAAAVESRDGEIERLQSIIMKLQRAQFVRRSERLDPDQLALAWKTSMPTSPASGRADTEHPSTIGAAIPMQAAARSSAARGRTARHRSSGLCVLWRRTPYDRREHQRDARLGPGTASRGPHHAPEIRLPCLRDGRASGMPPLPRRVDMC